MSMSSSIGAALLITCLGLAACASEETSRATGNPGASFEPSLPSAGSSGASLAPSRPQQAGYAGAPVFCERSGDDAVRDVFCGSEPARIASLLDLQQRLGLLIDPATRPALDESPAKFGIDVNAERELVLLNSSTALSGHVVSSINPRAIVITPESIMAFNRGVQQVELIAPDRGESRELNMYLLKFTQACNATAQGCSPGDLYTPRIEADWTALQVLDDEDLKNTASDCRQCHQRGRDQAMLLMRELDGPWTHFFLPDDDEPHMGPEPDGLDALRAYHHAKGDEPYGNLPWAAIRSTVGLSLQNTVPRNQPLIFDGNGILNERWPWDQERGFPSEPIPSSTWYRAYEAFKRGEQLAMPYFEPFTSDPDKLARLSERYRAYRAGEISADELPDLGNIFPDDPQVRAEIGLQTEPGASPAEALIQACGSCHNDVLDQNLSRARFNIDLARMDRAALDQAIARISLPLDAPGHMPPPEFRQLDPDALAPLVQYLQRDSRDPQDDASLQYAAQMGMTLEPPLRSGPLGP